MRPVIRFRRGEVQNRIRISGCEWTHWHLLAALFLKSISVRLGYRTLCSTLLNPSGCAYSVTALTSMAVLLLNNCAFLIDEIDGCALLDETGTLTQRLYSPDDRTYSMTAPTTQIYPPQLSEGQRLKSVSSSRNKFCH